MDTFNMGCHVCLEVQLYKYAIDNRRAIPDLKSTGLPMYNFFNDIVFFKPEDTVVAATHT